MAVGGAGGDLVADGELAVAAGVDLLGSDLAVGPTEVVGEAVELAAGGVAAVDHGVVGPVAVAVPPAAKDVPVHGEVVADDVEVAGGGEVVEGVVDAPLSQGLGGGPVVRVGDAVGDGELGVWVGWYSQRTRNIPPAAMAPCWAGSPMSRMVAPVRSAMVMRASRSRSDRVEASSTTRTVRASRGRSWGSSWARYQATVSHSMPVAAARVRAASPLTVAPTSRWPAAGPGLGAGGDGGGGLTGPSPSDGGLVAVSVPAPRLDQGPLLLGEVTMVGEGRAEIRVGHEGGTAVWSSNQPMAQSFPSRIDPSTAPLHVRVGQLEAHLAHRGLGWSVGAKDRASLLSMAI